MLDEFPKKRDFVREYLLYLQVEKGLAKNSLESYSRDLSRLKTWAEKNNFELLNLTRKDLREWLIDLAGENLSENSKRRMVSALRGFFLVSPRALRICEMWTVRFDSSTVWSCQTRLKISSLPTNCPLFLTKNCSKSKAFGGS